MAITCKASFSNARPVVNGKKGFTDSIPCIFAAPGTLVAPANANRVKLVLRNESTVNDLRYTYEGQQAAILTDGFLLKPQDAVDIESVDNVYVAGIGAAVIVSIDERTL